MTQNLVADAMAALGLPHQAMVGRRRLFPSLGDAVRYEAGWGLYPRPLPDGASDAMRTGWVDALQDKSPPPTKDPA